jgi:FdhE protein
MAVLRKGVRGRAKFLVCGTCRTEWGINRVECPYCDNDKQENIRIIEFDAEKDLRIDTCDACKSYIKTYTGNSLDDIAMRDFASIHIDIASQKTGFNKVGLLLPVAE